MDGKIWYKCDPEKADGCRKRSCFLRRFPYGCRITSRPEWAEKDENGKPVRVEVLRTASGFVIRELKE